MEINDPFKETLKDIYYPEKTILKRSSLAPAQPTDHYEIAT